ncbi:AAA family ATPase [Turicimonas muris]|uniref:AAA family ATPase n=1 Tax=Turicimonas muris TaxID=1796652 RepID=UPI0026C092FC
MDERKIKDLPLGTSDFIALRMADQLYVDKTDLVYKIASVRRKYFFFSSEKIW